MGYRDLEEQDRIHKHQLWWSFSIAIVLGFAAIFQWGAPKNALLEQDRSPAQTTTAQSNAARSDIEAQIQTPSAIAIQQP